MRQLSLFIIILVFNFYLVLRILEVEIPVMHVILKLNR